MTPEHAEVWHALADRHRARKLASLKASVRGYLGALFSLARADGRAEGSGRAHRLMKRALVHGALERAARFAARGEHAEAARVARKAADAAEGMV